jgi:hypothetical protein
MSFAAYVTREPSALEEGEGALFQGKMLVRAPKSNDVILSEGAAGSALETA